MSVTVPLDTVYTYLQGKGLDPEALAVEYVQKWAAKVSVGVPMTLAKMKCVLADGPCGCAEDSTNWKCTGPYLPFPIEVLLKVLNDGVEGVETKLLPACKAVVEGGHVHYVPFAAPFDVVYIEKVS